MPTTLYATFPDSALAERAAGALMDFGVVAEDISLLYHSDAGEPVRRDAVPHSATLAERSVAADAPALDERVLPTERAYNLAPADPIDHTEGPVTPSPAPSVYTQRVTAADATPVAGSGISTTTPADAAAGAMKGAGLGLAAGIVATLASLAVPGFGLVVGGGALAIAIAGTVGATAAGAAAGGVYGYLRDQGMPEDAAAHYQRAWESGHAVLAVNVPSGTADRGSVEAILAKYGAGNFKTFGAAA